MFENLQKLLRQRRDDGETNQSIAASCGLSQQRMNELLNGDAAQMDGIKLAVAYRLFPFLFRDSAVPAPPLLTDAETRILDAYRLADASERAMLDTLAIAIAAKAKRGESEESKEA